jgi:hypothetical protein
VRRERVTRAVALLMLAFVITSGLVGIVRLSAQAETFSAITIRVDHPSYGGISTQVPIVITARGGPAEDLGGNYSLTDITVSATNSTGFDWTPKNQMNELGVFNVNITMPSVANQTIKITVNVTSVDWNQDNRISATTTFSMKVVMPVMIKARVYNVGAVDAQNVTARFYIDGDLIKTQVFNLSAGNYTNLTYNWTFSNIRQGRHTITVTVDDPAQLVEFTDGNNVMTQVIYLGSQGNPVGAVLAMVLIMVAVLFVLTYLQKPVRRSKKS